VPIYTYTCTSCNEVIEKRQSFTDPPLTTCEHCGGAITARNVRASRVKDLWYGSLNYQIEHHLFPTMPRRNLRRAHALIKSYCQEIDVPFYEASMTQSYRELLEFLHEVGRPLRRGTTSA